MHTWRDLRNRLSLKIDVLKVFILFVVSSGGSSSLWSPAAGLTVCLAVCAARDWKYEGIESREIPRWRTAGKRVGDDHIWITLLWMQQVVSGMISSNVSLWQHKKKIWTHNPLRLYHNNVSIDKFVSCAWICSQQEIFVECKFHVQKSMCALGVSTNPTSYVEISLSAFQFYFTAYKTFRTSHLATSLVYLQCFNLPDFLRGHLVKFFAF